SERSYVSKPLKPAPRIQAMASGSSATRSYSARLIATELACSGAASPRSIRRPALMAAFLVSQSIDSIVNLLQIYARIEGYRAVPSPRKAFSDDLRGDPHHAPRQRRISEPQLARQEIHRWQAYRGRR